MEFERSILDGTWVVGDSSSFGRKLERERERYKEKELREMTKMGSQLYL